MPLRRESDPVLQGLERHERYLDTEELPHVIVMEARGAESSKDPEIENAARDFNTAFYA